MTDVKKAAILDGTGPTGRHLAPLLQERNQLVRALDGNDVVYVFCCLYRRIE